VSISNPCAGEADAEALSRLVSELQRYAGWLAKDHASVAVRASARALGLAMETGHDTSSWLRTLDKDIRRLPSGGVPKMLRRALREICAVLEPTGVERADDDRS
jgi:hypothetical protein